MKLAVSVTLPSPTGLLLDKFALDLPKGRIVGIVGPSGCGKTTLLNAIAGMQPSKSTRVVFENPAVGPSVSYCFQKPRLLPWLTLEKNVSFERAVLTDEVTQASSDVWLHLVGLLRYKDWHPGFASLGMQQ